MELIIGVGIGLVLCWIIFPILFVFGIYRMCGGKGSFWKFITKRG